ncbi:MAG: serine hydroxymethyltransferase [bacterium]|nr:serine hydroxymethyltransferase [bacterium]
MRNILENLKNVDPEIAELIHQEAKNEVYNLNMIASENMVSNAVLEAQGCLMTNKYAEGYPYKRYYGGCSFVDRVEELAILRAKELFGAEHVNVQPHSGSQANMAVYMAMLKPGDKIMGLSLCCGGHLTHGSKVNFSGIVYEAVAYKVNHQTQVFDFDELLKIAKVHRPKMIVCGASAYPRTIEFDKFRQIASEVGAYLLADIAHIAGLVAAKLHPDPIPYCDFVTTTTHKTLKGPRGGMIMCKKEYANLIDKTIFPGIQGGPLMHIIAAKAVCFKEALTDEFKAYQAQILLNTKVLAAELIKHGFNLVSGGTDTHLLLIDLNSKGITGQEAEKALEKAGIIVNKNTIPFDTKTAMITSGIRLGTPTLTARGMKEEHLQQIAYLITEVLNNIGQENIYAQVKAKTKELCSKFLMYEELL